MAHVTVTSMPCFRSCVPSSDCTTLGLPSAFLEPLRSLHTPYSTPPLRRARPTKCRLAVTPASRCQRRKFKQTVLKTGGIHKPPINSASDLHLRDSSSINFRRTLSSTGPSSPQTSFNSLLFSQNGSNSSRSTPSRSSAPERTGHFPRRLPRILVSSLLSDTQSRTYQLEVIQHPQRAAEFRNGPLSRLPVTPPLVAQLIITDPSGNTVVPEAELPFLIAHLSLYSENGMTRLDMGSSPVSQSSPILYGNLVSSVDHLEDLQGNMGLFFLFPDASIRWRGRYQLGVTLLRISRFSPDSSGILTHAQHGAVLAETRTRPFDVLARHQYTAVPQTRLTQCFIRQGARMFTSIATM